MRNPYLSFWGKADRDAPMADGAPGWHPAAWHMLDVAAVALAWLTAVKPTIPGLGGDQQRYWPTIVLLIALHDIGKFSRPFQAKRPDLWPSGLGTYIPVAAEPRHDTAGFALLDDALFMYLEAQFPSWTANDILRLVRAICGHHGKPPDPTDRIILPVCPVCTTAAKAFIEDLVSLLAPSPLPELPEEDVNALSWWLAGLTVLADWIGSNETWFRFDPDCDDMRDYWQRAQTRAAKAIAEAGVLPILPRLPPDIAALLPNRAIPAPMQVLAATLDLGPPESPALILIEDQTGSGKTEAALLLAHRLMAEKGARGVFIALPTMATANALHGRLTEAALYAQLFQTQGQATPSLVLAHGKRQLNERFAAALRAGSGGGQGRGEDDDADETATAQCAAWIGADRRRTFLADCGVGTIDQALHAVLPTRHAPLRLFGLRDRVLIIDEAHAYDSYMEAEWFRLVEFQTRLGGSTIILSATLPMAKRTKIVETFRKAVGVKAVACKRSDYPLVTVATRAACVETPCAPRQELTRSIRIERLADAEAATRIIAEAAQRGAAVAWIRNTVDDAIAAQALLAEQGVTATLFHARYAMGDRIAIEEAVQARFGRDSHGRQRAHVVVGTQVMEQSLDIDVDLMVTDLAPVDLMLQRVGRLWRHQRPSRPLDEPRLLIIAPDPVDEPGADWLAAQRGTAAVYDDPGLLWRSARAIFAQEMLRIPQQVRALVEAVYDPDAESPQSLRKRSERSEGKARAATATAWMNLMCWDKGYCQDNGPWMSDVRTPTRLGDPSLTLRLAQRRDGVLQPWIMIPDDPAKSWALSEIAVPMRRVKGVADAEGVAALRQSWSRMEQELPVLVLRQEGDAWVGVARDQRDQDIGMSYSPVRGLTIIKN